jgi:hypothetical protein
MDGVGDDSTTVDADIAATDALEGTMDGVGDDSTTVDADIAATDALEGTLDGVGDVITTPVINIELPACGETAAVATSTTPDIDAAAVAPPSGPASPLEVASAVLSIFIEATATDPLGIGINSGDPDETNCWDCTAGDCDAAPRVVDGVGGVGSGGWADTEGVMDGGVDPPCVAAKEMVNDSKELSMPSPTTTANASMFGP